ncbi:MAG: hypothetical protein NW203_13425 [Hyphomonadaceae bacterium]|nr:hypothetical protein [Hyphomonadaceae bacterium]
MTMTGTMEAPPPPRANGYGIATLTVIMAALSATATPEPDALAAAAGLGLPDALARLAVHAAPVAMAGAVIWIAQALARGRGRALRWGIFLVAGLWVGFFTGLTLTLFTGADSIIAALAGPLRDATLADTIAWTLSVMSVSWALMFLAIAALGRNAVAALQVEAAACDEATDIRRRDRATYAWGAWSMLGFGAAFAGVAMAHQGAPTPIVITIAVAGFALFHFGSWRLWRIYDELFRRVVLQAYAVSGVLGAIGLMAWALLDAAGLAQSFGAFEAFVAFMSLQFVATTALSLKLQGFSK